MKNIFSVFSLLLGIVISAQATSLSTGENYIYTKDCLNEDCSKKTEAVKYSDGLGRIKQTISIKATPGEKDIVMPAEYDDFGRQLRSYLPIPQSGTQNGAIYANPKSNASQSYGSDPYFYSESVVENSPAGRVLSQSKPGADSQGYSITFGYDMNASGDVKKYTVTTSWQNGATEEIIAQDGTFAAGQLVKTSVTDEEGMTTSEFKNGKGQSLMVRKGNTDTYYVYNKYGQLAFVIPPLASASSLDQTTLNNLCYQYKYDSKSRLVAKKIPGKGWEYFVYDKMNRLVMSQDANQGASKQWLFTKYDQLGRVVYTGIYVSSQNYGNAGREAEQNTINTITVQTENRDAGGFNATGVTAYYTNAVYPTTFTKILSINYYDTYPAGSATRPSQIFGKNTIGDHMAQSVNTRNLPTALYIKNVEDDNWTKSYTWYDEKARAIGTYSINHLGGYTKTESELDFAGVAKQTRVYHKRLMTDPEKMISQSFEYDHQNRLKKQTHQVDGSAIEILSENTYNELSQLSQKKVGNGLQTIDYGYNIRGALTKINDPVNLGNKLFGYEIKYQNPEYNNIAPGKKNGNISEVDWKTSSDGILKRYSYVYDPLNRLKDAIYSEPGATVPHNNKYNEHVTYDLNGNIITLKRNAFGVTGTTVTMVDDLEYQYTGNRLDKVIENAMNDTGYEGGNNAIAYDTNGNMKTMPDKGIQSISYNFLNLPNTFSIVQTFLGDTSNVNLGYLYRADGTKLRKMYTSQRNGRGSTMSTTMTDYLDGFQYTYSDFGGLLPCLTCKTESAYEEQAYKKTEILIPETPEWKLDFVGTSEGFYSFAENRYIYQYRDHLGNVRVSFARSSEGASQIIDANNYYPFGLSHIGQEKGLLGGYLNYKFGGKELQETGMFDFGARFYMPDLGRWGVIDPLAETSRRFTPYNYAYNNPIRFIDPDGRKAMAVDESWSWNIPTDSGWFTSGSTRRKFGAIDEFAEMTSTNEAERGGGGGNGGITITNPSMIALIQKGISQPGFIDGLFSMVEQLKKAGFKDPVSTKAKYEDATKISGITAIKDLVSILNYVAKQSNESNIFFEKNNNWLINGQSQGYKILLNMNNIESVLELAYIIGHETNHSITSFFSSIFYSVVGTSGPLGQNAFTYFTELVSYSWEERWGSTHRNLSSNDYTYFAHGPNSPVKYARHTQAEVDLVNNNIGTLLRLYNNFITIKNK